LIIESVFGYVEYALNSEFDEVEVGMIELIEDKLFVDTCNFRENFLIISISSESGQ
jgi:hypothetical protein